jgi:hypothetical protein
MLLGLMALAMSAGAGGDIWAQTAVDGAIRGSVVDAQGSGVAGAEVQVEDRGAGVKLQTTTGRGGEFVVARVPPGDYVVVVQAKGFERVGVETVAVEMGGVAEVDARLKPASVAIAVGGSAAEGSAGESSSGSSVTSVARTKEMQSLPVNGGRWEAIALVSVEVNEDGTGEGLLSFRGLPATENASGVDGVSDDLSFNATPRGAGGNAGPVTEDELEGGFSGAAGRGRAFEAGTGRRVGAAGSTFAEEAVREFRVSAQNYSAVYGRGAGGVINTVSKSGTDELHGAGFYVARASAWSATNPYSIASSYNNRVVTSGLVKP